MYEVKEKGKCYFSPDDAVKVGVAISEALIKAKMTAHDLSVLVGVSPSTICRYCQGKTKSINTDLLHQIEKTLGITLIMQGDEKGLNKAVDELRNKIQKLENENQMLKNLLIEKWS